MKKTLIFLALSLFVFSALPKVFLACNFSGQNIAHLFGKNKSVGIAPYTLLIDCDLRNSTFDGLTLDNVIFISCKLNGTSFKGANLVSASFKSNSTFGQTTFDSKTNFDKADLRNADFRLIPKEEFEKLNLKTANTILLKKP